MPPPPPISRMDVKAMLFRFLLPVVENGLKLLDQKSLLSRAFGSSRLPWLLWTPTVWETVQLLYIQTDQFKFEIKHNFNIQQKCHPSVYSSIYYSLYSSIYFHSYMQTFHKVAKPQLHVILQLSSHTLCLIKDLRFPAPDFLHATSSRRAHISISKPVESLWTRNVCLCLSGIVV